MLFRDRHEAGRILAILLDEYANRDDVLVLGLPRGGVPVAIEVAEALKAPLDVFVVRKLGAPGREELAIGAIAPHDTRVLNDDLIRSLGVSDEYIRAVTLSESEELHRRERAYRRDRVPLDLAGRVVILVDDGLASGASMRAALLAVSKSGPAGLIVAVPVGSTIACMELRLRAEADEVICARTPEPFHAVGQWYTHFESVEDGEVINLLDRAWHRPPDSGS